MPTEIPESQTAAKGPQAGAAIVTKLDAELGIDFTAAVVKTSETLVHVPGGNTVWTLDNDTATLTLDGSSTQITPGNTQNLQIGDIVQIKLKQDATGSRVVTWSGTFQFAGGTAPTLTTTANAEDVIQFTKIGNALINTATALNIS